MTIIAEAVALFAVAYALPVVAERIRAAITHRQIEAVIRKALQ